MRTIELLFIPKKIKYNYLKQFNAKEEIEITPEVYQKIAYRESTEGIIAIAKSKHIDLNSLIFKNKKNISRSFGGRSFTPLIPLCPSPKTKIKFKIIRKPIKN